jgi:hypothetical protein
MFSSTVLTLLVVPVFFIVFDDAAEWAKRVFWGAGAEPPRAVPVAEAREIEARRRTA